MANATLRKVGSKPLDIRLPPFLGLRYSGQNDGAGFKNEFSSLSLNKFKARKADMSDNDQDLIRLTAMQEVAQGNINPTLWSKAKELSRGQTQSVESHYITLRMMAMQDTIKSHVRDQIKAEIAKNMALAPDFFSAKDLLKRKTSK